MVVWPPQHGKTTLVSHSWPAYLMGKNPDYNIIHGAYNARRARSYGRSVRNNLQSIQHREFFPESILDKSTQAKDEMATTADGHYLAVGIGTGVTGWGAEGIVIDDPVKGAAEAKSEVMRENLWEWYTTDLLTRLRPNGWIVLIQTRWADDDLAGVLLKEMEGGSDQWHVHHCPAINLEGKALWEKRRPLGFLERKRRAMGPRAWSALYQGEPAPAEGLFFKANWLKRGIPPDRRMMQVWASSDFATSVDSGDYTVHMVFGLDPLERLWVLDRYREKSDTAESVDAMVALSLKWRPTNWLGEKGQIETVGRTVHGPHVPRAKGAPGPGAAAERRRQGAESPRCPGMAGGPRSLHSDLGALERHVHQGVVAVPSWQPR